MKEKSVLTSANVYEAINKRPEVIQTQRLHMEALGKQLGRRSLPERKTNDIVVNIYFHIK